jgi:hypothetical protein
MKTLSEGFIVLVFSGLNRKEKLARTMAGSENERLGCGELRRGWKEAQRSGDFSKHPMVEDGFGMQIYQ